MRLDQFLVLKKGIESRNKAQELIQNGSVVLTQPQEKILSKPSFEVSPQIEDYILIKNLDFVKYVSRAGLKLEAALIQSGLSVEGAYALDVGQSTGGFSDCLLQHGVRKIVGFDVGQSQVHNRIKQNAAVIVFENLNVKDLAQSPEFLAAVPSSKFDVIVCDVSFISLSLVMPFLAPFLKIEGHFLFLVKPQFECGIDSLDKNGIVKNQGVYKDIQNKISAQAQSLFGQVDQYFESSLLGKEGNKEFFIYGKKTI